MGGNFIKRLILLLIALLIISAVPIYAFSHIYNHWSKDIVLDLSDQGIIGGYPDGTYRPDNDVTAAEFLKLAMEAADFDVYYNT